MNPVNSQPRSYIWLNALFAMIMACFTVPTAHALTPEENKAFKREIREVDLQLAERKTAILTANIKAVNDYAAALRAELQSTEITQKKTVEGHNAAKLKAFKEKIAASQKDALKAAAADAVDAKAAIRKKYLGQ